MMRKIVFALVAAFFLVARGAEAQEQIFIQIEAQPSLSRVETRLRDYSAILPDVNGFSLSAGWYGIALGPYDRDEAQRLLLTLRAAGQIPRDSYLEGVDRYGQRIWPVGAGPITQSTPNVTASTPENAAETSVEREFKPADETPRQARASENLLTRDEKKDLQIALQWAGYYTAAIDGSFGRGTRGSMSAWQVANGYDSTGVLTTAQRAELFRQYNAVLDGMDIQTVTESRSGIQIDLPLGAVTLEKYDSPFVHFAPTGAVEDAKVLLISQPGNRDRLYGLYEIMQTLEVVPLEGNRDRRSDSFTLTGANDQITSYTQAALVDGHIKGFTLVWPANDEDRRSRILKKMQGSFAAINGVLDPAAVADDAQRIDLVAGLQIRQPKATASGFFVDGQGRVLTSREVVANCSRLTLNDRYDAELVAEDADTGLALLRATQALAPSQVAAFRNGVPRLNSEVAVAGYSFGGVLTAPTVTYGTLADLRGLSGENTVNRLAMSTLPGDAGGPVLDEGGAVIGMLLPKAETGRRLPEDVNFAVQVAPINALLTTAGISSQATDALPVLHPVDLTRVASAITVLVSCWE